MNGRIDSLTHEQLVWPVIPGPPRVPRVAEVRIRSCATPVPPKLATGQKESSRPPPDPDLVWASRLMGACALAGLASLAVSYLVH